MSSQGSSAASVVRRHNPKPAPQTTKTYAYALDGLRALCALGVLGYHMGFSWLSGGLHGVSILFVLSGYLVTVSLMRELTSSGTIQLVKFWLRRLWRLMPTAIAFVIVTLLLCVIFDHSLLTKMRPDIAPALLMYLNWEKIVENLSYFDAAGQSSPLTHFWSLAIEAQFYLVWPLVLLALSRITHRRRGLARITCVLAVASAVAMAVIYAVTGNLTRVYYGTDTRVMSLLVGAALGFVWRLDGKCLRSSSLMRIRRLNLNLVGVIAVAAIIAVVVLGDGTSPVWYLGGIFAISVLGALAIICLTSRGTIAERVLSARPLAWLGKRSYAIYVWHYPIIELMNPLNRTTQLAWWEPLVQVAVVLAAAELSYELVEQPLRRGLSSDVDSERLSRLRDVRLPRLRLWASAHLASAAAAMALVVMLGVGTIGSALVPDTTPQGEVAQDQVVMHATLRRPLQDGVYDVVLIGDSVSLGANQQLNELFPHGLIDSEGSRQAMPALEVFKGYLDEGVVGDTVIFSVGTNGWLTDDQFDEIVQTVGDRSLWFVNVRGPYEQYIENNAVIQRTVDKYDNVNLIDWHSATEGHDEYLTTDGIHLTEEGRVAYANLVYDTIGYEEPTEANTTYTVTTIGGGDVLAAADGIQKEWPGGIVDAADGRSFDESFARLQEYLDDDVVGENIIFSCADSGEFTSEQVDALVEAIPSDKHLWIVNARYAGAACREGNELIANAAEGHDNVEVADWYAASEGHDDYFSEDDGTTLTDAGREAFSSFVTSLDVVENA